MFYYIIALFVIALDQLTKYLIVKKMELGESIEVIEDFLYITSHRNRGAAWGILEGQMWFFYIITVVVIIGIVYYIQKAAKGKMLFGVSLGFMLGGAIGNFIDRVFRNEVVDFVNTYIFGYDFPVFNVADSALVIGVAMLMIQMLLEERALKKEKTHGENGTHHS
ncbi:signal peptidase II [Cytobacillus praedii]|uniref:Lipoprotein signal peptidase n=1 Tax=Cytobacillus praedii TaxID=1742358 RepID=A0A4R1AZF4_9BACI|nr:signal peptidase II [Cytobacillus praedii]MED3552261.1 signal peptidase II [Cytobacillus praedii]MED3573486.1 signal peptidase II [Cytobacillus praedii]TCJ06055.1 lipoprotein signal peptidase [Cytobacillus praedii]